MSAFVDVPRRICAICGAAALSFIAIGVYAEADEFTTLKGHGGPVMALAVSPEGQVATGSFDNAVGLWNKRVPQWLEAHEAAVTALAFADAERLITAGDDFALYLWSQGSHTGELIGRHLGKIRALAVTPDGDTLVSASWDGEIGLWPLAGGSEQRIKVGSGINDVAVGPGGAVYAATMNGQILVYEDAASAPRRLVDQGFGINQLVLGPDGDWLAYGAVDGATRVVDSQSGDPVADFTLERRPILAMAHHEETARLAVGDGQGYIMMVDTETWRISADFRATREGPVWALDFAPDGQTIWAAGLDDLAYGWPVALIGETEAQMAGTRGFLKDPATMPNGERQFMRKCSICHALGPGESRKAGPSLYGVFGRPAGTLAGYRYSEVLDGSDIIWREATIDALFDLGPDHYIPGSKMPMQRITDPQDRFDLIAFLKRATEVEKVTK
ncbi:c-type cytochrome [Phaeobacter gallaeciensis]|uniref:WD40 repeat protein n=1 Tax=Phaeobacter gallaeciensis TaxID=60890 RepID=A0AAC9Z6V1_9RHOB|nr:c-type cytochrome [Phaeobacter gallaeciensis]AHD08449.1 WD40 repeat protein [Phaeobacter gallaeciensis DSM 26640]ATE91715.1 WD40 repeat protein [Phaeobacter gallaeciensis]ATE98461.1 WD40 repeat protein [Phaeobacter gallaeciensis]ATF00331.1 WD40 repeat protein [Phaeobacter gallaeciensis]ATF04763.1 WD40 repeat protein [Phaeobacter gallaeciensis]